MPTGETTEELEWYLDTVGDEAGRKRLFSKTFIDKYEELEGNTRSWAQWAKGEFERIATQEQAHLQRELSREVNETDKGEPKWKMKVRLHSASHSVRASALSCWNEHIEGVKFIPVGSRKQNYSWSLRCTTGSPSIICSMQACR